MHKLLHAKKAVITVNIYVYLKKKSFIIECRCDFLSATSSIYFVWYRYALLRTKLTRNLDAWLLLAGKKFIFYAHPMCCARLPKARWSKSSQDPRVIG